MKFTEAEIKHICEQAAWGFYETFNRRPTEQEQRLMVDALTRFVTEPDAPSTRLQ